MLPLFALVNLLSALGALSAATPSRPKISCSSYVGLDADLFTPSRNGSSQTLGYKRITLDDGTRASAMARLPHNQTGYAHIKAHECNGQYYTSGFESGVNILQARTLDDTHCITVLSVAPYFNSRACGLLFANATGGDYGTDG
ncbi:unnamed protein product [Tilletia caries]|nr:unnamed protein product [Tilletia caries]